MNDWTFENFGWLILAGLVITFGGLAYFIHNSTQNEARERDAFMSDCYKHRQPYECTAMWRAGQSRDTTTVMPVVVPVGGR